MTDDHLAGDARGRGRPGNDLPIAGVEGEQPAGDLAVAAAKLEKIGAPANFERRTT
jgi:hypothetical protein